MSNPDDRRGSGFRLPPLPETDIDKQTSASIACVALGGAIAAVIIVAATHVRGEDTARPSFQLYAGDRAVTASEMQFQGAAGPFDEVATCYVAGALSVGSLTALYPDKVFMGRCDGGLLLSGDEMMRRAATLSIQQKTRGE